MRLKNDVVCPQKVPTEENFSLGVTALNCCTQKPQKNFRLVSEKSLFSRERRNHLQIHEILKHLENRLGSVNEAKEAEFLRFAHASHRYKSAKKPKNINRIRCTYLKLMLHDPINAMSANPKIRSTSLNFRSRN